jgi:polysaccharide biosynthesis/export protein
MKLVSFIFILSLLFSSCMHKKILYLQDKTDSIEISNDYINAPVDYMVKKNDILYVDIFSSNKEVSSYFEQNSQESSSTQGGNSSGFYLYGYAVNDTGYVNLPVLGSIFVLGKTMKEIQDIVQKKTDEHLNNAIATVRLVSFYVTFLGEVNSQGKLTIMQENVNILDGLALAGGVSDYGNKRNVLLVRKISNGTKTLRIDLTNRNLLTLPEFYLQPNDIVIVEPLKNKSFQMGVRDYTIILTTVTSTITMILLITSLFK